VKFNTKVAKKIDPSKWISNFVRENNSLEFLKIDTSFDDRPTDEEIKMVVESIKSNTSLLHFDSYFYQNFDILEILYRNAMLKKIKPKNLFEVRIFDVQFIWK
jgi:hypothetical protein